MDEIQNLKYVYKIYNQLIHHDKVSNYEHIFSPLYNFTLIKISNYLPEISN